jgi:hypothetical protein
MKRWVKEKTRESVDGEKLQSVTVYESEQKTFTYLVFIKK